MKISTCTICCLLLMVLACSLGAQDQDATSRSVRDFVQQFYSWYVPEALKEHKGPAWDLALQYRGADFDNGLARLLMNDSAAQARCEELVGIDFDPLLNTQDPVERYAVGRISQAGPRYRAEIYAVDSGKPGERADVSAEVVNKNGHWKFVNFLYPDGTNLVDILKKPQPKCTQPRPAGK